MKIFIAIIFLITSLIPSFLAVICGKFLGFCLRIFHFRHKIVKDSIKTIFKEKNPEKHFIKKVYEHFGILLIEICRLPFCKRLKTVQRINGQEFQEKSASLLSRKKGLCVLTGHFGNWELAGVYLANNSVTANSITIVKEMRSKIGDYILYRIRDCNGVKTINRKDAMRGVLKKLRENGVVVFVLDQNMTRNEGVLGTFFGEHSVTMASLATIVKKTQSPVIAAAVFRNDDKRNFTVYNSNEVLWKYCENDIEENTQNYNNELEKMLLSHPEQWIYMHKRWRAGRQLKK